MGGRWCGPCSSGCSTPRQPTKPQTTATECAVPSAKGPVHVQRGRKKSGAGKATKKLLTEQGLDVTVATYYRLQGDGEKWGIRAAAKHLGHDDDRVADLRAALIRRKPLEYQSFPCLVVRQTRKQKVPDNVPVELASFAEESKDDA